MFLLNGSHLAILICVPRAGPNYSISCKAWWTARQFPTRSPPPIYHACNSRSLHSSSASMLETSFYRAKENSKGPRGQPAAIHTLSLSDQVDAITAVDCLETKLNAVHFASKYTKSSILMYFSVPAWQATPRERSLRPCPSKWHIHTHTINLLSTPTAIGWANISLTLFRVISQAGSSEESGDWELYLLLGCSPLAVGRSIYVCVGSGILATSIRCCTHRPERSTAVSLRKVSRMIKSGCSVTVVEWA